MKADWWCLCNPDRRPAGVRAVEVASRDLVGRTWRDVVLKVVVECPGYWPDV